MARARKMNAMPQRRARRTSMIRTRVGGRVRQQRRRKVRRTLKVVMEAYRGGGKVVVG